MPFDFQGGLSTAALGSFAGPLGTLFGGGAGLILGRLIGRKAKRGRRRRERQIEARNQALLTTIQGNLSHGHGNCSVQVVSGQLSQSVGGANLGNIW